MVSEHIEAFLSFSIMALHAKKDNYFDTDSLAKQPRFNKDNFSLWKTMVEHFLAGSDPQIPYLLENGP